MIEGNIIESNRKNFYVREKNGIFYYSKPVLNFVNAYGEGSIDASLQAMIKQLKEIKKEVEYRIKIAENKQFDVRGVGLF